MRVASEVAPLTADREVPGSNPTMALGEFPLSYEAPLDQCVDWYPERAVSVKD